MSVIIAPILRQVDGDPIPQYYNPVTSLFEEAEGLNGEIFTNVKTSVLAPDASRETKQDSIISYVDGIEALLTAIRDTTGIKKITDALPSGTNLMGKIGIDQTTAGTTNGVVVNSSALPTGASTSAKQDTLIAKDFATQATLASLLAKVIATPSTEAKQDSLVTILTAIRDTSGIKKITDALPSGTNNIGDVDVLSSALPTGASTSAKQDSIITSINAVGTHVEGSALALLARTTTTSSIDLNNNFGTGIRVYLNVTAVATSDITLKIEGKDPVSGSYTTILLSSSVNTISTNVYKVYPGLTAVANLVVSDFVPKTFRITVSHNNANSTTYSVGYCLV
ncbi:MAG TPA: hypothetical protein VIM70_17655 [Clostridium sp.]|uniref:hypothetical protein n=1 Tax=Clostridium sp. TaxID=1506 RepID=UPI002F93A963